MGVLNNYYVIAGYNLTGLQGMGVIEKNLEPPVFQIIVFRESY